MRNKRARAGGLRMAFRARRFQSVFAIHGRDAPLFFHQPDKVAHLALERIHRSPGHGRIRHPGAAYCPRQGRRWGCQSLTSKNQHKVVAVGKGFGGAHAGVPSVFGGGVRGASVFLLKKSCRWWGSSPGQSGLGRAAASAWKVADRGQALRPAAFQTGRCARRRVFSGGRFSGAARW